MDDADRAVSETVKAFGKLDIMVNNAAIFDNMVQCIEIDDNLWDRIININLKD
jgi:NAD(P)-dependent dehydrogenase (short-subunit alcohol dehydrogenase family)